MDADGFKSDLAGIIPVIKASAFALKLLESAGDGEESYIGVVHSVYERTINIMTKEGLISLHLEGTPAGPLSLIIGMPGKAGRDLMGEAAELRRFSFSEGNIPANTNDRVFRKDQTLILHGTVFSYERCKEIETDVFLIRRAKVQNTQELVKGALLLSGRALPGLKDIRTGRSKDLISLRFEEVLKKAYVLCAAGEHQNAVDELYMLVGLGPGLTPAGDDFLCGVLAGMYLAGCEKEQAAEYLRLCLQNVQNLTNEISAAFIRCTCLGQFGETVCGLFSGKYKTADELLKEFSRIGHTSGIDTLCGIYFALTAFA